MYSLLIVDDEPAIRTLAARLARTAGCTISEAGCAGDALDRMAEHPSSVVLCDISMPDRSGLWLAGQLRQQFPDTALVMMSGCDHHGLEAGLENGAMASLPKPFSGQELLRVLERAQQWHLEQVAAAVWSAPKALPN